MNVNLLSLNVDWFRKGKRSGRQYEYFEVDCDKKNYREIISLIK